MSLEPVTCTMSSDFVEIIKTITPSIFALLIVLITPYVNNVSKNRDMKYESFSMRIKSLYIPFFKELYIFTEQRLPLDEMDLTVINRINQILIDNINCAETSTQMKIIEFYRVANIIAFHFEKNAPITAKQYKEFSDAFYLLYHSLFTEYKRICCKLKLSTPVDIAPFFDDLYLMKERIEDLKQT